jgi:hypothetical protein
MPQLDTSYWHLSRGTEFETWHLLIASWSYGYLSKFDQSVVVHG